jgi:hypothetical protein
VIYLMYFNNWFIIPPNSSSFEVFRHLTSLCLYQKADNGFRLIYLTGFYVSKKRIMLQQWDPPIVVSSSIHRNNASRAFKFNCMYSMEIPISKLHMNKFSQKGEANDKNVRTKNKQK